MITERIARKMVQRIAMSYLGTFYTWGGDDPSGFDCSGLVIECLKSVGMLPRSGDWTADALSKRFPLSVTVNPNMGNPNPGDLVMWYNKAGTRIIHVEIYIGNGLSIGASGGGSKTKTITNAIKHNAFIKIRPVASRGGKILYCDPYK